MVSITRDERGRYVVADETKTYGAYRTAEMAEYRVKQLMVSTRPPVTKGPAEPVSYELKPEFTPSVNS